MPILSLTDDQVEELVKQLPSDRMLGILVALAKGAAVEREARMGQIQRKMRDLAAERGLSWDSMSEEERERFVDDLLHEEE